MKPEKAIPITIVTGFLGAGKTSLINHLLQTDCHQCQAVLVNDFGAVEIGYGLGCTAWYGAFSAGMHLLFRSPYIARRDPATHRNHPRPWRKS